MSITCPGALKALACNQQRLEGVGHAGQLGRGFRVGVPAPEYAAVFGPCNLASQIVDVLVSRRRLGEKRRAWRKERSGSRCVFEKEVSCHVMSCRVMSPTWMFQGSGASTRSVKMLARGNAWKVAICVAAMA